MEQSVKDYQKDFASYMRQPKKAALPSGAPQKRMDVYADLFINSMEGILSQCFPVTKEWMGIEPWRDLVRRFYTNHVSITPYFREIPREFMEWISTSPQNDLPPFLPSLVHWEWVELVVETMDADVAEASICADGVLCLTKRPVVNPTLLVAAYDWPVHKIHAGHRSTTPEQAILCSFRDKDHNVKFIEINSISAQLIDLLQPGHHTGKSALVTLAADVGYGDENQLMAFGAAIIQTLYDEGAILGFGATGDVK